jgi:RHS repeat-associated protein
LIIGAQPSVEVVTNQSETHVNFDNLIIRRWKPQVRVTYDYYPFGLTWENPKLPGTEEGLHDHTYQDKEYQFAEFSDGRGLELHDFHARMYDATTGRWLVPDPAAQFANPYLAMGNNPLTGIDPDGRVVVHILIGAAVGGVINWIAHGATFDERGFSAFAIGAVAGGLTAATGGAATALVGGAGAGGFAGGAVIGAFSATAGNVVLSEGNHHFLGDPRWSDGQYLVGAGVGALFGGVSNGMTAKGQGNSFWSGASTSQSSYSYFGGGSGVLKPGAIGTNPGSRITPSQLDEWWDLYWRSLSSSGEYLDDAGNAIARGSSPRIGVEIIATKGAAKAGQNLLITAGNLHRHHVLPQQFRQWFAQRGVSNIDDYTIEIGQSTHLKGVHGKGLNSQLPGNWNKHWADFIKANPNASRSEIFHHAEGLLKRFGFEHLPYVPYR